MNFWDILSDGGLATAIVTSLAGIIGSLITYLVAKNNTTKDIYVNDRESLSEGQQLLMANLNNLIEEQKESMREYKEEISILRLEIKELQQNNINLLIENKQLSEKITQLSERINDLREGK